MGRRNDARSTPDDEDAQGADDAAYDLRWAQDVKDSLRCAGALLALLLCIDWGSGSLTFRRGVLWFTLALLLFLALYPARVSAGEGWLSSRRLLREHRVRTDLLVSVRCREGISQRLVFRDAFGGLVEIDPEVLVRNPPLWYRLDAGAHQSAADGLLLCGGTALRRLSDRVEREAARAVFRASGLE